MIVVHVPVKIEDKQVFKKSLFSRNLKFTLITIMSFCFNLNLLIVFSYKLDINFITILSLKWNIKIASGKILGPVPPRKLFRV